MSKSSHELCPGDSVIAAALMMAAQVKRDSGLPQSAWCVVTRLRTGTSPAYHTADRQDRLREHISRGTQVQMIVAVAWDHDHVETLRETYVPMSEDAESRMYVMAQHYGRARG